MFLPNGSDPRQQRPTPKQPGLASAPTACPPLVCLRLALTRRPWDGDLRSARLGNLRRAGTDLDVDAEVSERLPPSVEFDGFRLSRRQIDVGRGPELDTVQ